MDISTLPREEPSKREVDEVVRYSKQKKSRSCFVADENFSRRAVELLREQGLDVITARDAGLIGHSDEDYTAFALREGRVLLTQDQDFLWQRRFNLMQCPAIVVFDFGNGTDSEIRQALALIAMVICYPKFYDRWCRLHVHPHGEWSEDLLTQRGEHVRDRYRVSTGRLEIWVDDPEPASPH